MITKIISKIRRILKKFPASSKVLVLCFSYVRARLNQALKSLPENSKKIFFVLEDHRLYDGTDGGNGRYIFLIINRFVEAGYTVYFYKRFNFNVFRMLGKHGRLMFKLKNLKISSKLPANTDDWIYAFDSVNDRMLEKKWKKLVFVNTFKPPYCQIGDMLWLPYFMHAINYRVGQNKLVDLYRSNVRKIKMVFAGNTIKRYYNNPRLGKVYGHMTRIEGINALLELGDKVKCEDSREKFTEIMNIHNYSNECRVLLTDDKFPIKPDEWFQLLSVSDFFVCLSGTDLPMCHNVIEAMAVGTIPIIQYHDWFFPGLEHNKNAIIYSGKQDLQQKIRDVLNMPADQIDTLRKNVIKYYEQYLSAESFIQKFEKQKNRIFTIMMHPRLICKQKEEDLGKKLNEEIQSKMTFLTSGKLSEIKSEEHMEIIE